MNNISSTHTRDILMKKIAAVLLLYLFLLYVCSNRVLIDFDLYMPHAIAI